VKIQSMTDHTGAEVLGVDLARPVAPEVREALNRAFVKHSVLVIRDQALKPAEVLAGVELFGSVFLQHNTRFALPECPQIQYLSNQDKFPDGRPYIPGEGWHTDHSNDTRPPKATVLYAVTLPDRGGDTQYANMAAAYEALPAATQQRIANLMAIHVYQSSHSTRKRQGTCAQRRAAPRRTHSSGARPQVDLHQPDPHRRHCGHGPQGGPAAAR